MDLAKFFPVLHGLLGANRYGLPIWHSRGDPRTALLLDIHGAT